MTDAQETAADTSLRTTGGAPPDDGGSSEAEVPIPLLEPRDGIPPVIADEASLAEVIAAFDVAVLTSLWEGLPRVLVQYALLEKPIVTFDVEGAREVVHEGTTGYVVPRQDVELLTDRLRQLLESATLRRRFGAAARANVAGRWDVERMVAGITDVYRTVESEMILLTS